VTAGWEAQEPARARAPARRHRIDADPEDVERSLVSLVLTVVELLRQLMERQALRRVDQGSLTDDQVEKLGSTLMSLEDRMAELREHFGLSPEDLNLDLGPLGPLLPQELRLYRGQPGGCQSRSRTDQERGRGAMRGPSAMRLSCFVVETCQRAGTFQRRAWVRFPRSGERTS
jgi:gas vesicle protein GvpK